MGASLDAIYNEVVRLNEKLDALPGLIEVNASQVKIISLDELSETLGLIKAGEFRTGNLRVPGDSFSGLRIGYPGFYYPGTSTVSSDLYNIAGIDLDTLAVGISATDGKLYFDAQQLSQGIPFGDQPIFFDRFPSMEFRTKVLNVPIGTVKVEMRADNFPPHIVEIKL